MNIRKFLCKIGIHDWEDDMSKPHYVGLFDHDIRNRICLNCGKYHNIADKLNKAWDTGYLKRREKENIRKEKCDKLLKEQGRIQIK